MVNLLIHILSCDVVVVAGVPNDLEVLHDVVISLVGHSKLDGLLVLILHEFVPSGGDKVVALLFLELLLSHLDGFKAPRTEEEHLVLELYLFLKNCFFLSSIEAESKLALCHTSW